MRPYWEAKSKLGLPREIENKLFDLETNLHARILELAGTADRELKELANAIDESEIAKTRALELAKAVH